ncbi:GPR1/FUN34/YaaH family transporter [Streptacidiphilus sp. PAMC 29251]
MTTAPAPETVHTQPRPDAPAQRIGHAQAVGAAGFAWCSLALGLSTIGVFSAASGSIVLAGTFFYGGIVQLVAGFFALAAGATFAAAFLTAYGAFWLGYTAIEFYVAPHIVEQVLSSPANKGKDPSVLAAQAGHSVMQSLGLFLLAWLVVTVVFAVASAGTNAVTLTAFGLLTLTIVLLLTAYFGASAAGVPQSSALHGAGYVEIVLALVAFYLVLAELANETFGRTVFPLFPFKRRSLATTHAQLA